MILADAALRFLLLANLHVQLLLTWDDMAICWNRILYSCGLCLRRLGAER